MSDTKKTITLLERRYRLLRAISNLDTDCNSPGNGHETLLARCCDLLVQDNDYCLCWVGRWDENHKGITPLALAASSNKTKRECHTLVEQVLLDDVAGNPAAQALHSGQAVVIPNVLRQQSMPVLQQIARMTGFRSCCSIPILFHDTLYGALTIHSEQVDSFTGIELEFVNNIVTDIGSTLYAHDTTHRLRIEREFTDEIFDTVQALLVSISHCGEILSFNAMAEEATGFRQEEVRGKYWVDILMDQESRKQSQQLLSDLLKKASADINFQAILRTKAGIKRTIAWHGSIRQHIEQGRVGMVLFGLDVTDQLETHLALDRERAKWQNIFSAMQDPVLIVTKQGIILDANPATLTAARKERHEIIGKRVCDILHGNRQQEVLCPLETLISTGKSRILETELRGLHGSYLLTINPLENYDSAVEACLLLARDLTVEEQMKAEALRAAQLASIGELAAGVAHEINNPINGIINYAEILKDMMPEQSALDFLCNIIKEGKRIAAITSNLLDFSRKRDTSPEPVNVLMLLNHCLQLIRHQFSKDGIVIHLEIPEPLPDIFCNPQQIQQVLFNLFSNSRYALNEKYPQQHENKLIIIAAKPLQHERREFVRLTITDHGTGISHDIMSRLMDPFFSTKPSGLGTGLGLSISHGLVRDNGGMLKISSEWGSHTTITVDLPAVSGTPGLAGASHHNGEQQ